MMLPLVLALSVVVGLALGLLGGGGSILMVPALVFAAGLPPKAAIATSLLVVAATSALALVPHARAGNVRWKIGLVFAGTAMLGAFAGGRVASFIPGWILLLGFGLMMLITALAMLRTRAELEERPRETLPYSLIAVEGMAVGALTGMVGAGGGFLVVPALAMLGGLSMREAIGTSLLVIALKSMAGFAGYASHVAVDYRMVSMVIVAAVVGSQIGAAIGRRVSPAALRIVFGWLVAVVAVYIIGRELLPTVVEADWFRSAFVEYWPWWLGGLAIAAATILMHRCGACLHALAGR